MKELAKVMSLFMVLIFIALIPVFVMECQNNQLINQVNTENFTPEEVAFESTKATYSTLERIQIIQNSVRDKTGIATTTEHKLTADEQRVILSHADKAIKNLQIAGFVPDFEVTNTKQYYSIRKTTFSDSKELSTGVGTYNIQINYTAYTAYVTLDAQTSKIYTIAMVSHQEEDLQTEFNIQDYISYLEVEDLEFISKQDDYETFYSEEYDFNVNFYYYKNRGFLEFGVNFYK